MKILVDENIPSESVRELRKAGHDVLDIRGSDKQGVDDDVLWSLAQMEARLLITTDKGFANHRSDSHHGILIVRLHQPDGKMIHARVMLALKRFPEHEWPGLLVVMRDTVQSIFRA
jgi:predicted nuclease of predicted toxin-antitoxin system